MATFFANYPGGTSTGSSGGGGTGNSITIDTYTLTSMNISNMGVVLSKVPTVANKVVVLVESAPDQAYGVDYVVDSNLTPNQTLDWTGLGLAGILTAGDIMQVIYY